MDTSGLFRVDGMVAVVSGGGTGIGLMITKALAGAGAKKVYILGRRESSLNQAVAECGEKNSDIVRPIVCDVTSKESLESAVDVVRRESGGYVNLVVANSGIYGPANNYGNTLSPSSSSSSSTLEPISSLRHRMFDEVEADAFTETFRVNVTGAYLTAMAFLELLDAGNRRAVEEGGFGAPLKQGSKVPSVQSQIVVTESVGSFSRQRATPPAYGASKAAVGYIARHAATNLAAYQIRVNTLAPGFFPSEMADGVIASRDPETETVLDENFMPARRFGTEEEMAGSILFLASRAGAYCDGMILLNDGGRLAVVPSV